MKNFFSFLIALVCAITANAAEPARGTAVLSGSATELTPLVVTAGKSVKAYMWIDIQEEQEFTSLEADLYVPEGVEVVGAKESTLTTGEDEFGELYATHTIQTELKDGYYKVVIYSNQLNLIGAKRGSVAQINLKTAASFEGGMAQFKNVIFGCVSNPSPFDTTKGVDCDLFPIKETNHPAPQSNTGIPSVTVSDIKYGDGLYFKEVTCVPMPYNDGNGNIPTIVTYTTDGSTPTAESDVYAAPIKCFQNMTIKFQAYMDFGDGEPVEDFSCCEEGYNESKVTFVFDAPTISADGGHVTISTPYENATNYYSYDDVQDQAGNEFTLSKTATVSAYTKIVNGVYATFTSESATKEITIAAPRGLSKLIKEGIAGKAAGETLTIDLNKGEEYPLNSLADAGLVNLVINGNGAVVNIGANAQITGMQRIEINNVNFNCAEATLAPIALSAAPDSAVHASKGNFYGSTQNVFVDTCAIVLNGCNFAQLPTSLVSNNKAAWILGGLTINNCVVQFCKSNTKPYIDFESAPGNVGAIKNFTINASTLFNDSIDDAHFIKFANASNGQASKAFPADAKEYITFTNNTFVNICTKKNFGNNVQNNNGFVDEVKGNVFFNTYRLNKYFQTNNTFNFTVADNAINGDIITIDATDKSKIATEDTLLALTLPVGALDFNNISALKANFTPSATSYAGKNGFGDPRWVLLANQAAADSVMAKINAIGTVEFTDKCKQLIDSARVAYNALTTDQKALVSADQLEILTEAETVYAKLTDDHAAADSAVAKINAIGTVELTDKCKQLIDSARVAYDALTADQKALVSAEQLEILTEAEKVFNNSSEISGDVVIKSYENLGWNEYDIIFTMKAQGAKTYPITLTIDPETTTFVGTFAYSDEEETLNRFSIITVDGEELYIQKGSTVTITNNGNGGYTISGELLYNDPETGELVTLTLDNLSFSTDKVAPNTILTAGEYEITATITANEGIEVPAEMQKYLGGYTAQGELTGDSLELVISTTEAGFVLNGFSVKGDAVILNDEAEVVYGDRHFQLGDAEGNTNGALAITQTGENEYTLADGTIVYKGNVVGKVTGIIFKMIEDPTTAINSIEAKAVKSGKFLENGKLVIIRNGVKYGVAGQVK